MEATPCGLALYRDTLATLKTVNKEKLLVLDLQDLRTGERKVVMERRIRNSDTYGGEIGLGEGCVALVFLKTLTVWSRVSGEPILEKQFGETLNTIQISGNIVFTGGYGGVLTIFTISGEMEVNIAILIRILPFVIFYPL